MFLSRLLSCGFVCEPPEDVSTDEIEAISLQQLYDIRIQSNQEKSQRIYRHSILLPHITKKNSTAYDKSMSRVLTNDPFFGKIIQKSSGGQLFFPSPNLYEFECDANGTNTVCYFGKGDLTNTMKTSSFMYETPQELVVSIDRENRIANVSGNNYMYIAKKLLYADYDVDVAEYNKVMCKENFKQVCNNIFYFIIMKLSI